MKKILLLTYVVVLTGCFGNTGHYDDDTKKIQQSIEQLNETDIANLAVEAKSNKSLKNAFKVFEQFDEITQICNQFTEKGWGNEPDKEVLNCSETNMGICDDVSFAFDSSKTKVSFSKFSVVFGKYCDYQANCPNRMGYGYNKEQQLQAEYKDKKFNMLKNYFLDDLSAKDKAMLQKCMTFVRGGWWTETANGCREFWEEYSKSKDSNKCLFNYKAYLPNDIKINSYNNFVRLYVAYKESIFECNTKIIKTGNFVCDKQADGSENCYEQEHKLTDVEKQQCYDEVEKKLNALAKSGDL